MMMVLAAACSSSEDSDSFEAELAGTPLARFLPDGPVHGVIMAAGVDEDGSPLQSATTFDPADPETTAIVALGAVPQGATLTVEWRRIGAGIDASERLFAHQIEVEPFQRAYSVGVSEGVLAPGLYEVTASLSDHAVSALWRVADEERSSGSASPAGDSEAQPPAAGDSGAIDRLLPPGVPEGYGFCEQLNVYGDALMGWFIEYDVMAIGGSFPGRSPDPRGDCPTAIVSAAVSGSAVDIDQAPPNFGDWALPCLLPGGTDMPGTVVHFSVRYADDKAEVDGAQVELIDIFPEPIVVIQSNPENGSRVEAGDTVTVRAEAIRLPWSKGLRWAELRSPEDVLARDEREATPCDLTRHFIKLDATYTVPEDPPPVIELTAVAEDHDGIEATETITLVTEETWEGTMHSETKRTYMNPENAGQACTDAWKGELAFTVDEAGVVKGEGEAALTSGPACEFPAGHAFAVAKKAFFTVEGDVDEAGFTLRLGGIRWVPETGASIAGFHEILGTGGGTVDAKPPGPAFEIPKLDPCTAEGDFTTKGTVPPFDDPTAAKSTMELHCSEPQAG